MFICRIIAPSLHQAPPAVTLMAQQAMGMTIPMKAITTTRQL
jgi:hypothetical protein